MRDLTSVMTAGMVALMLTACGGGGGGSTPPATSPPPAQVSHADAVRFLEQASFGPTADEVAKVQADGFDGYLSAQFGQPKTGYNGFVYVPHTAPESCTNDGIAGSAATVCHRDSYSAFQVQRQFFQNALTGQDQLRQRVAFALSQILVISASDVFEAYGSAGYQNLLLDDAFGNFRDVLNDVTLSPAMGRFLDMVNNDKSNAAKGTEPNENYARELMQLFTVGVYQLNTDGTIQTDASGNPIAAYDQSVVQGYAQLFTGWSYAPLDGASAKFGSPVNYSASMVLIAAHHDTTAKHLINGISLPAGQDGDTDLKAGLDALFNHPNVGPFIATRLIQHLVTSNPSSAYVGRVAAVFNDDGGGTRGDLKAVVRAILLDPEARGDVKTEAGYGHLREPALFVAGLLRTLGGQSDGVYLRSQSMAMGQAVFAAPSVFNFYPPDYQIPGYAELGPEFAIQGTATALSRANFVNQLVYGGGAKADPSVAGSSGTTLNLSGWQSTDATALVSNFDAMLTHGTLAATDRQAIETALGALDPVDGVGRTDMTAYLFGASPQYQVER